MKGRFVYLGGKIFHGEELLDLRTSEKSRGCLCEMNWLDPKPVAAEKDNLFILVIYRKRPHAPEPVNTIKAPAMIRFEQNFGIRLGNKCITFFLQLIPQLDIIVDLSIKDQ